MAQILQWKGKKLSEVPFFASATGFPGSLHEYQFQCDECTSCSAQNLVDGLKDGKHVVQPSSMTGADIAVVLCNLLTGDNAMLTIGCRFYSSNISKDNADHNLRTTDIDKQFLKRTEEALINKPWAKAASAKLKDFTGHIQHRIRIAVCLPGVVNDEWEPGYQKIVQDKHTDHIFYVMRHNVMNLLPDHGEQLLKIMDWLEQDKRDETRRVLF